MTALAHRTFLVESGPMPMEVIRVAAEGLAAGTGRPLVLAHHRGGVDDFTLSTAERLADIGTTVFVPDLFHGQWKDLSPRARKAQLRDDQIITDLKATADLVQRCESRTELGIIGFCMGGRVSLLAATGTARYNLALSFYGGDLDRPWGQGPTPVERGEFGSGCSVEFHHGRHDTNPSPGMVHDVLAALRKTPLSARAFEYDAGHAFMDRNRPEVFDPTSADIAWQRIEETLVAWSN